MTRARPVKAGCKSNHHSLELHDLAPRGHGDSEYIVHLSSISFFSYGIGIRPRSVPGNGFAWFSWYGLGLGLDLEWLFARGCRFSLSLFWFFLAFFLFLLLFAFPVLDFVCWTLFVGLCYRNIGWMHGVWITNMCVCARMYLGIWYHRACERIGWLMFEFLLVLSSFLFRRIGIGICLFRDCFPPDRLVVLLALSC